jgi:hypothetical protein
VRDVCGTTVLLGYTPRCVAPARPALSPITRASSRA